MQLGQRPNLIVLDDVQVTPISREKAQRLLQDFHAAYPAMAKWAHPQPAPEIVIPEQDNRWGVPYADIYMMEPGTRLYIQGWARHVNRSVTLVEIKVHRYSGPQLKVEYNRGSFGYIREDDITKIARPAWKISRWKCK